MANSGGPRRPNPYSPLRSDSKIEPPKKKDAWDKAQIISGFLASVVIAAVGILINVSIQQAQLAASKASTEAQIQVSERNNKAQLALTERTAEFQRHLQEGTLTGQLLEHVTSGNTLKKKLVIIALRGSLRPDLYQDLIITIVKHDTDPEVRKTALEQVRTLPDVAPAVAQAIADAATDENRSTEERQLATNAVRQIGLVATAPTNSFVLASSGSTQVSKESASLRGGVFTHYLLRGLSGEASVKRDGNVRLAELSQYVTQAVSGATNRLQVPVLTGPANVPDPLVVGPDANYSKIVAIAIGNQNYRYPQWRVRFGETDAESFADFWLRRGATISKHINATRRDMQQALKWAQGNVDKEALALFYYSGHAISLNGRSWLVPVDADTDEATGVIREGISATEIRDLLSGSTARTQIVFIDASFSGAFVEK